jgi:hypothetical protein
MVWEGIVEELEKEEEEGLEVQLVVMVSLTILVLEIRMEGPLEEEEEEEVLIALMEEALVEEELSELSGVMDALSLQPIPPIRFRVVVVDQQLCL